MVLALLFSLLAAPVLAKSAQLKTSDPLPVADLAFTDANGLPYSLSKERSNKLTVVHFWATWCPPCVVELPQVDKMSKKLAGDGIKVLSITIDDPKNPDKIRNFYAEHGITTLPLYFDSKNAALRSVGGSVLPLTLFLDKNGKEIGRVTGPLDWSDPSVGRFIYKSLP